MSTRTSHVAVRFTAEELAQVRARARATHTPLARFIRHSALGHTPRARQLTQYADLVHALNRIGIALATAHDSESVHALEELRTVLHAISDRMGYSRVSRTSVAAAALE